MPCSLFAFLLQNSQFWLAECQADNSLLDSCARVTGQRLLHGLWPLENPQFASPQVRHFVPCQAVVYHIRHIPPAMAVFQQDSMPNVTA